MRTKIEFKLNVIFAYICLWIFFYCVYEANARKIQIRYLSENPFNNHYRHLHGVDEATGLVLNFTATNEVVLSDLLMLLKSSATEV